MSNLRSDLSSHQVENEWHLCVCAFAGLPRYQLDELAWITPDNFVLDDLGRFWAAVQQHGDGVRAANDLNLTNDLLRRVNGVPDLSRADEYARAIGEDVYLRNTLANLTTLATHVRNRDSSAIANELNTMREWNVSPHVTSHTPSTIDEEFRRLIRSNDVSLLTHLPALDNKMGGMFASDLIVIASRPGAGKTALVLQIARNIAYSGKRPLLVSLEMERTQLWARMACPMAGIEWKDVRAKNVTEAELQSLEIQSKRLRKALTENFIIVDDTYTVHQIHQAALHHRPDIVLIDQLPEIRWHERDVRRNIWYGRACKYLRDYVAKSLRIPVALVHQIGRSAEMRDDKRPQLSDLRWSGEIEQRADVVLLGYRADMYQGIGPNQTTVAFEIDIAKNRQGWPEQRVVLDYDLPKQEFT